MCFLSPEFRAKHPDALKVSCFCGHQFSSLVASRILLAITLIIYLILFCAYRDLYDYHTSPGIVEPIKWICLVIFPVVFLLALVGVHTLEHSFLVPQIAAYSTLAAFFILGGISFGFNALHLRFLVKLVPFLMVDELLQDKAIAVLLSIVFFSFAIYFKFSIIVFLKCYIYLKTKSQQGGSVFLSV